jgi:hypothetical protein
LVQATQVVLHAPLMLRATMALLEERLSLAAFAPLEVVAAQALARLELPYSRRTTVGPVSPMAAPELLVFPHQSALYSNRVDLVAVAVAVLLLVAQCLLQVVLEVAVRR